MTYQSPAQKYRNKIRDLGVWNHVPENVALDHYIYERSRAFYLQFKHELEHKIQAGVPKSQLQALQNGVYLTAIVSFVHGHLEAVEDILDNVISKSAKGAYQFVWMVRDLLPMPDDIFDPDNQELTRQWLHDNGSKLQWDHETEIDTFT